MYIFVWVLFTTNYYEPICCLPDPKAVVAIKRNMWLHLWDAALVCPKSQKSSPPIRRKKPTATIMRTVTVSRGRDSTYQLPKPPWQKGSNPQLKPPSKPPPHWINLLRNLSEGKPSYNSAARFTTLMMKSETVWSLSRIRLLILTIVESIPCFKQL